MIIYVAWANDADSTAINESFIDAENVTQALDKLNLTEGKHMFVKRVETDPIQFNDAWCRKGMNKPYICETNLIR
jgi:hypothetical protein